MTKRVETAEGAWKNWNWRSDGDITVNGAYFVASGEGLEVKYEKAYSVEPKSATFIDQLTMSAGVFGSRSFLLSLLKLFLLSFVSPLSNDDGPVGLTVLNFVFFNVLVTGATIWGGGWRVMVPVGWTWEEIPITWMTTMTTPAAPTPSLTPRACPFSLLCQLSCFYN